MVLLLLKVTLELQTEGMPTRVVLDQERMEREGSMGCVGGLMRTEVPGTLLGTWGWCGGIEHKVLAQTVVAAVVVFAADRIGSQRLRGRGRGKPCLLLVIRGERRNVDRGNGKKRT